MDRTEIRIIRIDVYDDNSNNHYLDLHFVEEKGKDLLYKSQNDDLLLKVSLNNEYTIAHLLEKDTRIVDDDSDIELRVLEAAFEAKLNNLETAANGFDDADESEFGTNEIDPYDPKLIRVDPKNFSVQMVIDMINNSEIDLSPAFQRRFVWNDITRKSRLIESLLLRIPIPVFYFAQDEEGLFQVVDGVQRLTVLKSFMNNEFKLKNLEYLKDCEGKWYKKDKFLEDSLDSLYTRRIEQTQLFINIIDPQTPGKVKYDIFRRINTGGKELNNQEIRNCLANAKTRELLRELAGSSSFKKATRGSVKPTRMADEELVLRFVAFYLIDNEKSSVKEYKGGMDSLLDSTVEVLNKEKNNSLFLEIRKAFLCSMNNAYYIFGDKAFRKANYINKSLFLGLSRVLCQYSEEEVKQMDTADISERISQALDVGGDLWNPLSMGTNDAKNISTVYEYIKKIMEN